MDYAICHTKDKDVQKCVQAMVEAGHDLPIVQTNPVTYKKLESGEKSVPDFGEKHKAHHKVDTVTHILHTTKCKKTNNPTWDARIINPKATGLVLCTCVKKRIKK